MMCLNKDELFRVRLVNEMKRMENSSNNYKLVYYPGGNLVLLKLTKRHWVVKKQTGPWFLETKIEGYKH